MFDAPWLIPAVVYGTLLAVLAFNSALPSRYRVCLRSLPEPIPTDPSNTIDASFHGADGRGREMRVALSNDKVHIVEAAERIFAWAEIASVSLKCRPGPSARVGLFVCLATFVVAVTAAAHGRFSVEWPAELAWTAVGGLMLFGGGVRGWGERGELVLTTRAGETLLFTSADLVPAAPALVSGLRTRMTDVRLVDARAFKMYFMRPLTQLAVLLRRNPSGDALQWRAYIPWRAAWLSAGPIACGVAAGIWSGHTALAPLVVVLAWAVGMFVTTWSDGVRWAVRLNG